MTGTSKLINYETEAQKETKKKKNQEPAPVKEQEQAQAVTNVVARKKFAPEKVEEKKINVNDAFSPSTLAWIKKENLDAEKILKAKLMDRGPKEVKTNSKGTNLDEILSQQQAEKFNAEMKKLKLTDKEMAVVSLLYKDKKDNKFKMNEKTILAYHSTVEDEKKAKEAYAVWKGIKKGKETQVAEKAPKEKYKDISDKIEPIHTVGNKPPQKKEKVEVESKVTKPVEEAKKELTLFEKLYGPNKGDLAKLFAEAWKNKPVEVAKKEKPPETTKVEETKPVTTEVKKAEVTTEQINEMTGDKINKMTEKEMDAIFTSTGRINAISVNATLDLNQKTNDYLAKKYKEFKNKEENQ